MCGDEPLLAKTRIYRVRAFPACAGMNRFCRQGKRSVCGVPRMCGDEPTVKAMISDLNKRSPHVQLIDQIELADAKRVEHLIELAQLRNLSLDELMNQLSIHHPPAHA